MTAKTISIVAYNTHLFGEGITDTIAGAKLGFHDEKRRDQIISNICAADFDVVCLCEVWPTSYKKEFAAKGGYPFCYFPYSHMSSMGDGLVILSKLPLYHEEFLAFEDLSGTDNMSAKGVTAVAVRADEERCFRIFFTHTQADDAKASIRARNFAQIADKMRSYYPGTPALLLGDLNVPARDERGSSAEYEELGRRFDGLWDVYAALHPTEGGYTCVPGNSLARKFEQTYPARYDYIWATKNDWSPVSCEVMTNWTVPTADGVVECSDHYPLAARLELKGKARIPLAVQDTIEAARETCQGMKAAYGSGVSNLIVLENRSGKPLKLRRSISWTGSFWKAPPPIIPAGKFAAALHHKPNMSTTGSEGCLIYEIEGTGREVAFAFLTPWSLFSPESHVTAEFGSAELREGGGLALLRRKLQESAKMASVRDQVLGCEARGEIESGTSPVTKFSVII